MIRALFKLVMEMEVEGVENLPASGPVILASNHLSDYDMFPMQFAIPRLIFFMAKAELHRTAWLDPFLRQLGSFPVERGARDQWALDHAGKILAQDQVLGIFPEGTRSREKGLLPGKTGAARLAIEYNCPVVLMALTGTQHILKDFPHRAQVRVAVAESLYPNPEESPLDFTDRLMYHLADHLPPKLRGVYAERPRGFKVE